MIAKLRCWTMNKHINRLICIFSAILIVLTILNYNYYSRIIKSLKSENSGLKQEVKNLNLQIKIKNIEIETLKRERKSNTPSRGQIKSTPRGNSIKSFMDYRTITNKSSSQYALQQSNLIYFDEIGLQRLNEDYVVAVGTYYAKEIGDRFKVTMESGYDFTIIVGDFKDDMHTDDTNRQHLLDGSIIEFIVDGDKLPRIGWKMGDVSYLDVKFKGEIKELEVLSDGNMGNE